MGASVLYTVDGKSKTVEQWSRFCDRVSKSTVRRRLLKGVKTRAELNAPCDDRRSKNGGQAGKAGKR